MPRNTRASKSQLASDPALINTDEFTEPIHERDRHKGVVPVVDPEMSGAGTYKIPAPTGNMSTAAYGMNEPMKVVFAKKSMKDVVEEDEFSWTGLSKEERQQVRLFPNNRQGKRAARRHIEKQRRAKAVKQVKKELSRYLLP